MNIFLITLGIIDILLIGYVLKRREELIFLAYRAGAGERIPYDTFKQIMRCRELAGHFYRGVRKKNMRKSIYIEQYGKPMRFEYVDVFGLPIKRQ